MKDTISQNIKLKEMIKSQNPIICVYLKRFDPRKKKNIYMAPCGTLIEAFDAHEEFGDILELLDFNPKENNFPNKLENNSFYLICEKLLNYSETKTSIHCEVESLDKKILENLFYRFGEKGWDVEMKEVEEGEEKWMNSFLQSGRR